MKRTHSISSPASSTPPLPPAKRRRQFDSDAASSDCSYSHHAPSDSPTNPFGRFKLRLPRSLPRATPTDTHLVLRFQLATQPHNVFRVVAVPSDYTFWHLSRLCQFLFGWKDTRFERDPVQRNVKHERKCEHVFTVQKDVVMFLQANKIGMIKTGRTALRISGEIKGLKQNETDEMRWEREESYTLANLWPRGTELTRAVHYDRDVYARQKEVIHITLCSGSTLDSFRKAQFDGFSNTPLVLQGAGLPDDDEDDEFQLDLLQWNEDEAFENFMQKLDKASGLDDEEDEDEDSEEFQRRLAVERALVRRRMSAPLPKKLPIDDEFEPEPEEKPRKPLAVVKKPPIIDGVEPEGALSLRAKPRVVQKVPPRKIPTRSTTTNASTANTSTRIYIEEEV